jgi:hypothetical protein
MASVVDAMATHTTRSRAAAVSQSAHAFDAIRTRAHVLRKHHVHRTRACGAALDEAEAAS